MGSTEPTADPKIEVTIAPAPSDRRSAAPFQARPAPFKLCSERSNGHDTVPGSASTPSKREPFSVMIIKGGSGMGQSMIFTPTRTAPSSVLTTANAVGGALQSRPTFTVTQTSAPCRSIVLRTVSSSKQTSSSSRSAPTHVAVESLVGSPLKQSSVQPMTSTVATPRRSACA